jgi:hypothetical protein
MLVIAGVYFLLVFPILVYRALPRLTDQGINYFQGTSESEDDRRDLDRFLERAILASRPSQSAPQWHPRPAGALVVSS